MKEKDFEVNEIVKERYLNGDFSHGESFLTDINLKKFLADLNEWCDIQVDLTEDA